jgi:hypothetical protein
MLVKTPSAAKRTPEMTIVIEHPNVCSSSWTSGRKMFKDDMWKDGERCGPVITIETLERLKCSPDGGTLTDKITAYAATAAMRGGRPVGEQMVALYVAVASYPTCGGVA